jgi:uncharacterized membrane protein YkgB
MPQFRKFSALTIVLCIIAILFVIIALGGIGWGKYENDGVTVYVVARYSYFVNSHSSFLDMLVLERPKVVVVECV